MEMEFGNGCHGIPASIGFNYLLYSLAHAATIERQKQRRDKLANALRDNKKRLLVLEQEINILTEPVPVGESERLDRDIKQLAEDCQQLNQLLNRINGKEKNLQTNFRDRK